MCDYSVRLLQFNVATMLFKYCCFIQNMFSNMFEHCIVFFVVRFVCLGLFIGINTKLYSKHSEYILYLQNIFYTKQNYLNITQLANIRIKQDKQSNYLPTHTVQEVGRLNKCPQHGQTINNIFISILKLSWSQN